MHSLHKVCVTVVLKEKPEDRVVWRKKDPQYNCVNLISELFFQNGITRSYFCFFFNLRYLTVMGNYWHVRHWGWRRFISWFISWYRFRLILDLYTLLRRLPQPFSFFRKAFVVLSLYAWQVWMLCKDSL